MRGDAHVRFGERAGERTVGNDGNALWSDFYVVVCTSRRQAEPALQQLTGLLADLGLRPKAAKTRIVHLRDAGKGA